MVRKAARTVRSLEKPQDSPKTRTNTRRWKKSESESDSDGNKTVSSFKNESSGGSEQEYEQSTRKSGRSTKSTKPNKKREKSSTTDEEEDVKEGKTRRRGKSKDKSKRNKSQPIDIEIQNKTAQVTNQSPSRNEPQSENFASNLTDNSNFEEPQPDNHNDDSIGIVQPVETTEFSSVNVDLANNVEDADSNIISDPLADPLETQAKEKKDDILQEQSVEEVTEEDPQEAKENPEKQRQLSAQDEDKVEPVGETEKIDTHSLQNFSKGTIEENSKPKVSKKIHLKRPVSEKKERADKQEKPSESKEKAEIDRDKTPKEDKTEKVNKGKRESKSKITLKRPCENRQVSVDESKKETSAENHTHSEETLANKGGVSVSKEEKLENEDGKEEGEWSSSYEVNGQDEDFEKIKTKEETSSRRKISLKRRTTTEEDERKEKFRGDKVERTISLNESSKERRRSHRESESDFEIKKRPAKALGRSFSENEKIITSVKPKKPTKVVKINRTNLKPVTRDLEGTQEENKEQETPEMMQEEGSFAKKYKWGLSEAKVNDRPLFFNTVKQVCPSVDFLKEEEVDLELSSLEKRRLELEKRKQLALERKQEGIEEIEIEVEVIPVEEQENILAKNRNISIVDDTASKLKPPPSPAKNPVSNIVYVSNLVRPFTVRQLRDLLERTGNIKNDGFWTDKIKSKCYVVYETSEEAEATRNALHGVNWPIGNGKQLVIEYATEEEMEKAKNPPPPIRKEKTPEKENKIPALLDLNLTEGDVAAATRDWDAKRRDSGGDRIRRDSEGHRRRHSEAERDGHRRHSRSRSRDKVKKHGRRSLSVEDHHHKKKRHEESVEQKAMDDLFMKTKATPSIYWQPLSPEEIAQKQRQREARLQENRRRMEIRPARPPPSTGVVGGGGGGGGYRDRSYRRR